MAPFRKFLFSLTVANFAFAQLPTGTILGVDTDPSEAIIPSCSAGNPNQCYKPNMFTLPALGSHASQFGISPTAGLISSTTTTARQIQLALEIVF
jgi:hypothetical protein